MQCFDSNAATWLACMSLSIGILHTSSGWLSVALKLKTATSQSKDLEQSYCKSFYFTENMTKATKEPLHTLR